MTRLIATAGFPKKPDGTPMDYRTAVKVGVIFAASKNKARAKEFVKFLLQEDNLRPYVEGALGRWFPVTKAGQESPFWQADKHRKAVYDQFKAGTLPFEFTKNYKFTILNNENVWAKAMNRVVNEKVPVDKAVDELIARIKQVAGTTMPAAARHSQHVVQRTPGRPAVAAPHRVVPRSWAHHGLAIARSRRTASPDPIRDGLLSQGHDEISARRIA